MTQSTVIKLMSAASLLSVCAGSSAALAQNAAPSVNPVQPASPLESPSLSDPYQIAVRADRRSLDPVLAVRQEPPAVAGQAFFISYSNYRAFIEHSEIRLFARDQDPATATPLAVLPLDAAGTVRWQLPEAMPKGIGFVLRAYGANGTWDETRLRPMQNFEPIAAGEAPASDLFGSADEAARRTIAVSGITLTVQGAANPQHGRVLVNGTPTPVSQGGTFVSEQIVPTDKGQARVEIRENDRTVLVAQRHYDAAEKRWFVVSQGDITFSHAVSSGPAVAVSGDPLVSGNHVSSRGAFYAKGLVGKDYRVTASLDTGETLLKDMFSNLDRKNPTQLLRRVSENYHYPTFGDSSTIIEDAPSQGRFYLRVQKDDSNLVVGNFITAAKGTELVQLDRGLFGVMLDYKSRAMTNFGERKSQLMAFASDPGTVTASDELRGTGGSLYYLSHQDLSVGSERMRLEVRSPDTGAVLASTLLRVDEDYEIDYFQGRVTLLRPVSSYLPNDQLVRSGASAGNVPVLVARYEYSPPQGTIGGHSLGGRASQWVGDWLQLGVTGQSEKADPADQLVLGTDVMLRATDKTWIKGEYGRSDGPGFTQASSLDGGINYTQSGVVANPGQVANSWRIEAALDEADLSARLRGKASGYYEEHDAGFAAMGQMSPNAMQRWGATLIQQLDSNTRVVLADEGRSDTGIGSTELIRGELTRQLPGAVSLRAGLRHERLRLPTGSVAAQGERFDGGVQLTYAPVGGSWQTYVFGQATLDHNASRRANDRTGLGFKWDMGNTLSAEAEASHGTGGTAINARLNRRSRDGSESYLGYRLYSDVTDRGYDPQELLTSASKGTLVVGQRWRMTDTLTLTGEEKYGHGGTNPSLTHSYGMRFVPDKQWSFGLGVEQSTVRDTQPNGSSGIDRLSGTVSASYASRPLTFSSAVEYRRDRQASGEQSSWLFRDRVDIHLDDSWHLLGRFDYAFTDVSGRSLQAANYTQAIAGVAYRPIVNDRLNMLMRYTYLRDLGPAGQVMTTGGVEQPKQVSKVISADISYDLTGWLTVGGKYAWRQGRVSITRASDTFVDSAASLIALRGDVHIARRWDLLVEGRQLTSSLINDKRNGVLVAAYRHLGSAIKVGVGYNFTDYSADLTDQSYSSRGVFVNLLAAL